LSGQEARSAASTVAALYVEKDGAYFGLPDVDPWDEERDARLYAGPWPVVAHPPCNRWCQLAFLNQAVNGLRVGDDGGTFEAALNAVRAWGGVLEHPAHSHAWAKFDLPKPPESGWQRTFCGGWVTRVDQGSYGHRGNKPTWLYAVVDDPPAMNWQRSNQDAGWWIGKGPGDTGKPRSAARRLRRENASKSPPEFRDALLDMARSVQIEVAA
jgi:hypothetical protein